MKNKITSAISSGLVLGALALALIASPVKAMAQTSLTKIDIPFAFQIDGATLPAGSYIVSTNVGNILALRNRNTGKQVLLSTLHDSKVGAYETGSLVFTKYSNGQYFLRDINVPNTTSTYRCFRDKKEKALIHSLTTQDNTEVAVNIAPSFNR
jgi:hypothetical protein